MAFATFAAAKTATTHLTVLALLAESIIHGKMKDLIVLTERHMIYTYKGNVYQAYKFWTFKHCAEVLTRLGATYWEIG